MPNDCHESSRSFAHIDALQRAEDAKINEGMEGIEDSSPIEANNSDAQ